MKILQNYKRLFLSLVFAGISMLLNAQPWAGSQNPMAQFYKEKGWPGWTDLINWNNKINMANYSNGSNDFEKFENARDQLAISGGGVLYYPSGTYDFSNHPTGPQGRGLMLKKGVVILGDAPTTDTKAIVDSVTPGLGTLGTKFLFPFKQKAKVGGGNGEAPDPWNMIGLYADANTRVANQVELGIAWVNIVGGYVYFGPDMPWGPTYQQTPGTFRKAKNTINTGESMAWNKRVPDGTFPLDPFAGAYVDSSYVHTEGKRFVFGCRLDHSAVNDEFTVNYVVSNGIRTDSSDAQSHHPYRFAARINMDGPNIFCANNAITKSNKNFYYEQRIRRQGQIVPGSPVQKKIILWDYAKQAGIDVNKQLISQRRNRCDYRTGPMVEENIIIKDNYVYNHGHKGFELAGKWMIIKDNVNDRDFLGEGDDVYGLGGTSQTPSYELTLEGWAEAGPNSDNLARAFDLAGWNGWVDGNFYQGTGSIPGNDGEGILFQPQGGVGFFSFAETFNRQGPKGKDGYIAPYDVPVYGLFQAYNRQRGGVGVFKTDTNRIEDAVAIENYRPSNGTLIIPSGLNATNLGDISGTCSTIQANPPSNLTVEVFEEKRFVKISWADSDGNEAGFRIDRKAANSSEWVTIAYRPRHQTGSFVQNLSIKDNGIFPPGCRNQGQFDLNAQEWYDFLGVRSEIYQYRVVALTCENDNESATLPSPFCEFPPKVSANADGISRFFHFVVSPNPASESIELVSNGLNGIKYHWKISDLTGKIIAENKHENGNKISVSNLKPAVYFITVKTEKSIQTKRFIKE